MKKTVFATALALATSVVVAPVAVASPSPMEPMQQAGPGSMSLAETDCREVKLTAKLGPGYPAGARFEIAVFAGPNSGGAASENLGLFDVTFDKPLEETFKLDRDSFGGKAFIKASQAAAGPDPDVFQTQTIVVDTSCARDDDAPPTSTPPTSTPPPTEEPDPAEEPEPTEEPDPTETPEPTEEPAPEDPASEAFVDLDCKDFPLADGRTAQDILNQFPGDPHGLDADEDRIACEPGQDTAPDSSSDFEDPDEVVVTDEKVAVPEGGVATGVGPA